MLLFDVSGWCTVTIAVERVCCVVLNWRCVVLNCLPTCFDLALCCFELASEAEHVFADFNFFNRGRDLGTVAVSLWSPLIFTLLCQASLFHCHAIVFTMFRFMFSENIHFIWEHYVLQ